MFPSSSFGENVEGLPPEVQALYDEARGSMSVSAYTGAVLLCRKILMHVAVEMKADENLKFIEYVQYLADNHYVPPNAKGWVDHIRTKVNEATHEIVQMSQSEAEQLISFTEILLKLIYELPQRVPVATQPRIEARRLESVASSSPGTGDGMNDCSVIESGTRRVSSLAQGTITLNS